MRRDAYRQALKPAGFALFGPPALGKLAASP